MDVFRPGTSKKALANLLSLADHLALHIRGNSRIGNAWGYVRSLQFRETMPVGEPPHARGTQVPRKHDNLIQLLSIVYVNPNRLQSVLYPNKIDSGAKWLSGPFRVVYLLKDIDGFDSRGAIVAARHRLLYFEYGNKQGYRRINSTRFSSYHGGILEREPGPARTKNSTRIAAAAAAAAAEAAAAQKESEIQRRRTRKGRRPRNKPTSWKRPAARRGLPA